MRLPLSRTAEHIAPGVFAELRPRIDARLQMGKDIVGLHIGDAHGGPPEGVRFAALEEGPTLAGDLYRYGDVTGLPELKETFSRHLLELGHGPEVVSSGQVLVCAGATHALFCAARAVLEPGDEVLVAAPYWPLAPGVFRAAGGVPVEVSASDRLYADAEVDVEGLLGAAVTDRTRAMYFASPNNPDGKIWTARQLAALARFAVDRKLWVFADEVYEDYAYDVPHTPFARAGDAGDQTISIHSLSKSRAIAGARVGFAVGPERMIALGRRIQTHTVFHPTVAAQRLAIRALAAPWSWVDRVRSEYRAARDATVDALRAAGVAFHSPDGGSYVFVDFAPVLGRRSLKDLLEQAIDAGVLLAPGEAFGQRYGTCARLCFTAVPPDRLREGLARLRRVV